MVNGLCLVVASNSVYPKKFLVVQSCPLICLKDLVQFWIHICHPSIAILVAYVDKFTTNLCGLKVYMTCIILLFDLNSLSC